MNIFKQSLEEILANKPLDCSPDLLPGVPDSVSVKNAACILAVSPQTIERMVEKGDLIPTTSGKILKADLIGYISSHALADVPVLGE